MKDSGKRENACQNVDNYMGSSFASVSFYCNDYFIDVGIRQPFNFVNSDWMENTNDCRGYWTLNLHFISV